MSVGEYAAARARRDRRARRRPRTSPSSPAAPASTCAPRSPTSRSRLRPTRTRASALERLYDADPTAAYARLAGARSRRAAAVVHPQRPPPGRASARARRGRRLARARAGPALVGDDCVTPTLVVGLDVPPDELERRIRARTRRDVRARRRRRGSRARSPGRSRRRRRRRSASRELTTLPLERGARPHRRPHAPVRRVPAQVDAPDPGHRPDRRRPTRRRRWSDAILDLARAR